jgi:hypothetical protein
MFDLAVTESRARVHGIVIQQGGALYTYEAYGSIVNGTRVLNLRDLDASKRPWTFLRHTFLTPQVLQVAVLSKDAVNAGEGLSSRRAVEGVTEPAYVPYCVCLKTRGNGEDGS